VVFLKEKYIIRVIVPTGINKLALIQLDKKKRNDTRWIHNPLNTKVPNEVKKSVLVNSS
jgi:hypothetical protein